MVKYEELVENPELVLSDIFNFLDVPDQKDFVQLGLMRHFQMKVNNSLWINQASKGVFSLKFGKL